MVGEKTNRGNPAQAKKIRSIHAYWLTNEDSLFRFNVRNEIGVGGAGLLDELAEKEFGHCAKLSSLMVGFRFSWKLDFPIHLFKTCCRGYWAVGTVLKLVKERPKLGPELGKPQFFENWKSKSVIPR